MLPSESSDQLVHKTNSALTAEGVSRTVSAFDLRRGVVRSGVTDYCSVANVERDSGGFFAK